MTAVARSPGQSRLLLLFLTAATVFLANAGMLVLQLLAGRYLAPFVGSSVETWTSVIGAFLTGIALGNWYGGSLADRSPTPRTLSVLLALGAASALLMPLLAVFGDSTGVFSLVPLGLRIPVVAAIFCLAPAFFLATITPSIIKLSLRDVRLAGSVSGIAFALGTLGCLLGNYLTGFVLMASYPLDTISFGVAALLGILALLPLIPGAFRSVYAPIDPAAVEMVPVPEARRDWLDWSGDRRIGFAVVFLCSFCGMTLELTGSRILAPVLGVSIYTWTGIIGVMLAGTATGNYLGGVLADRGAGAALLRLSFVLAPLVGFALAWPAWNGFLSPILFGSTPTIRLDRWANIWTVRGVGVLIGIAVSVAGCVLGRSHAGRTVNWSFFGGCLGASVVVPFLQRVGLFLSSGQESGRHFLTMQDDLGNPLGSLSGQMVSLYLLGFVLGAIAASLMYRFGREPRVGRKSAPLGSSVLAVTLFLAGMFCLVVVLMLANLRTAPFLDRLDPVEKVLAWTFLLFYMPMTFLGMVSPQVIRLSVPSTAAAGRTIGRIYAVSTLGAIVGTFAAGYLLIQWIGTFRTVLLCAVILSVLALAVGRLWANNALLYAWSIVAGGATFGMIIVGQSADSYDMETRYYAIRVSKEKPGELRSLSLDHLVHSAIVPGEPTWLYYRHEYVQGEVVQHLRVRHPDDTDILIVGGGGYTFPRFVEVTMPDVRVEVVEIDPGVTEIAHRAFDLPRDTAIVTHNMDGRQFVSEKAAKGRYRAVIQDAVNDLSVPYHLLTKEYNDDIRRILTDDGAYMLTFIDSLTYGKLWRAAAVTMRKTFPHVYLLSPKASWKSGDRDVYILYGSNEPLDLEGLRRAHAKLALKEPGSETDELLKFSTNAMPPGTLDDYLENLYDGDIRTPWKPPVLTDQYAPVDNLMSGIFRNRRE